MDSPVISVVVASHNRTEYLKEAVDSVVRQTRSDWELIIADDGSAEPTRVYLQSLSDPRIRVIWLPHTGNPSAVRNAAIKQARGRYVALLDSDDCWMPDKLGVQLEGLRSNPECRWSYTYYRRMDEAGRENVDPRIARWIPHEGWILEQVLRVEALIATPSVMVDRALLDEVGGFDEEFVYCEDYDLWVRLAMRSPVRAEPAPLCWIRVHSNNHSAARIQVYESWDRLYHKAAKDIPDARLEALCRRRRAAQPVAVSAQFAARKMPLRAIAALVRAASYCWRYGEWWAALGKAVIRALIPDPILARYRRSQVAARG
jgi:glycosyltransferase involved in cell wall biosynthesis